MLFEVKQKSLELIDDKYDEDMIASVSFGSV